MSNIFKTKRLGLVDNILWGISGEVFVRLIKFFQLIIIAQFLGASGLGIYNYGLAIVASLSIFFDFGILIVATKNNSKNRSPADLTPYFLLKICTSILGLLVFYFVYEAGFLIKDPEGILFLVVISMLILDFANLIFAKYRAEHNFHREAKFRAFVVLLQLTGSLILLALGANLKQLVYCFIAINSICLYPILHLLWNSHETINFSIFCQKIKNIFKQCIPLAGLSLFGALYTSTDVLFLGFYYDAITVAVYTVAIKFILGIIITPVTFIQNAQIPNLAELTGEAGLRSMETIKSWSKAFFNTLYLGILICLFFAIFSEFIISITFGEEFNSSAKHLSALTVVGLLYYIYTPFMTLLIVGDNTRYAFCIQFICSITNIVMLFLLVPSYGIAGAVIAAISTHALIAVLILPCTMMLHKQLLSRNELALIIISFLCYALIIGLIYSAQFFAQGHEFIFKLSLGTLLIIIFRRQFISLSIELIVFFKNRIAKSSDSK